MQPTSSLAGGGPKADSNSALKYLSAVFTTMSSSVRAGKRKVSLELCVCCLWG